MPVATLHTTVNDILVKTLLNNSVTTFCGPLCPTVSLQALWQQHSGAANNPMMLIHIECSTCPITIGRENILAIELITRCAQVTNGLFYFWNIQHVANFLCMQYQCQIVSLEYPYQPTECCRINLAFFGASFSVQFL